MGKGLGKHSECPSSNTLVYFYFSQTMGLYCFFVEWTDGVVEELAFSAEHVSQIAYCGSNRYLLKLHHCNTHLYAVQAFTFESFGEDAEAPPEEGLELISN